MTNNEENKILEKVLEEVFEDCKKIGFKYGDIREIKTSKRFTATWEKCSKDSNDCNIPY